MSVVPRSVSESSRTKRGDGTPSRGSGSAPSVRHCPVCQHPQTKIQRRLGSETHGSVNYVCARASECPVGIDLAKVDTWAAV
jgi:hypothetical protein